MDAHGVCAILTVPLEIRRAIYAYVLPKAIHISPRSGGTFISPCENPKISRWLDGYERRQTREYREIQPWVRRLQSSWGFHWQCEEAAHTPACSESSLSILSVSKRIRLEVCDWLASSTAIHVADLHTLDLISRMSQGSLSNGLSFLSAAIPAIRTLHVTVRLPFEFFQALESITGTPSAGSSNSTRPPSTEEDLARIWLRVWPGLAANLGKLQSLHLWLDHTDRRSWSLVNERKVLSSVIESISPDPPHTIAALREVILDVPFLHPRHEDPERHFTRETPVPESHIRVDRRLRQRYYYDEFPPGTGCWRVDYQPDFPFLLEFRGSGQLGFEDMTKRDMEEYERMLWERGQDVEEDYRLEMYRREMAASVCYHGEDVDPAWGRDL